MVRCWRTGRMASGIPRSPAFFLKTPRCAPSSAWLSHRRQTVTSFQGWRGMPGTCRRIRLSRLGVHVLNLNQRSVTAATLLILPGALMV
jgi:hypothetical protein